MALRVAVIGLGPIGNLHSRIYLENPQVELVGICDRNPDRAREAGEKYAVPSFTDAAGMLRAFSPDLVSVATGGYEYSSDHYEPTMQALAAGCHVLCEKPICNDLGKAREMVEEAKKANRCFGIDFNHRFTPAALAAKAWFDAGELGSLLFCNMALWIGKFGQFETPNYHLKALNPHSINLMTWFCGPIEAVQCFAIVAPGRNIWSTASINVRFASGTVGHLTSSYDIARAHTVERCEVAGVNGRLVIDDMWREATLYPAATMEKRVYSNPVFGGYRDFDDTFRARINRFVEQVSAGVAPADIDGSGADGLAAQRTIHAAIRSLEEGNRCVQVSEI
ncbi:MAG: Gfo/Idh/MocA family oxidoreductase [Capsulimonadaceae bacterium]|nr:Gfo/Idh/MocA family oxidoreductase [Capsulimonadaceae bacterium]